MSPTPSSCPIFSSDWAANLLPESQKLPWRIQANLGGSRFFHKKGRRAEGQKGKQRRDWGFALQKGKAKTFSVRAAAGCLLLLGALKARRTIKPSVLLPFL